MEWSNRRYEVVLMLTDICNYSCIHCINKYELASCAKSYLYDIAEIDIDVELLSKFDEVSIEISGGEPTLHPKFNEIVSTFHANSNSHMVVMTNMYNMDMLMKMPVDRLKIIPSIHYEHKDDETISKIERLHAKYDIVVSVAIDPNYLDEILEDIVYLGKLGIPYCLQPQCDATYKIIETTGTTERLIEEYMPDHVKRAFLGDVNGIQCKPNLLELTNHILYWSCTGDVAEGDVEIQCPKQTCLCGVESILRGDLYV